ncbi:MAG: argininosuccinate lyase [Promethearchaeota archaeon]
MMDKDIYRKRLKSPLNKEVLAFLSSLKDDSWIAEEDIIGTEVHDIMLFEQGILNISEIQQILISLEKLKKECQENKLILSWEQEDIHPLIEQRVIEEIGIEIGGKIHTGRSRNDQVSVDLRLKIRKELNSLTESLLTLFETLFKLSTASLDIIMPLYTHLQRAQLGSFSHYLNAYLEQILRNLRRIEELYHRINKNPLGSCAIGGTSINIDRSKTTELLGFDSIVYNSIDAVSSKDFIIETLTCLSIIALDFSRIAEDLLLWASKEFDYVELDDQYCSVSSVMPQKKNPDTLELMRSGCAKILSNAFTGATIIKSVPTGYFRDFQDLKPLLRDSFNLLLIIIKMLNGIFSTLIVKKANMRKAIEQGNLLALDIAEYLVQHYNLPFRQAHEILARLSMNIEKNNNITNKNALEAMILEVTKKKIHLPNDFDSLFKDPGKWLENRISQGAPSKKEMEHHFKLLMMEKQDILELFKKRKEKTKKAEAFREARIQELIHL